MPTELITYAEFEAEKAQSLTPFSGVKLLHVKREVERMLGMVGRDGIFDEYTVHTIEHVDEMLHMLEWLIPEGTKAIMKPADWFLQVLAIYFHDLGMLVTRNEYEQRSRSGFRDFAKNTLFAGDDGEDYRVKVCNVYPSDDDRERFLYQEYVRHHHADRVAAWIMGDAPANLGVSHQARFEVIDLLGKLDEKFRSDLALVCRSHHLNDLDNLNRYRVSQPYGNRDAATANVQYAALMLRTADLLHIAEDRTPAVTYRLINPADPTSQGEWAKQRAVKRVRPRQRIQVDDTTNPAPKEDTIEVHAYFKKPNGFFGLTRYLEYAKQQIKQSHDWARMAQEQFGSSYEFNWRRIDDSNIEAHGFLKQPFAFELDKRKILDLLTGHTLYNDTNVVLRELAQNSLDAVRLQELLLDRSGSLGFKGEVKIEWKSKSNILTVLDNGTGMTQEIIERHFLGVGSSRYEDPEFKKEYPSFTAISRFGIGILSCFMVADEVDVITVHPSEEKARHLSLRSVHGKYLIRLLDKVTDRDARRIGAHGTLIKMKLRPSAKGFNPLTAARRYLVVPKCKVTVTVDNAPPVRIGYDSPHDALVEALRLLDVATDADLLARGDTPPAIKVIERQVGAATVAYAVRWSEFFRDWAFLLVPRHTRDATELEPRALLGTCVEGVRVENGTPGFRGWRIVAIANTTGRGTPRTNVARSSLEVTDEYDALLGDVYAIYRDHIAQEIQELHSERAFSLAWAVEEAQYLVGPLVDGMGDALRPSMLQNELKQLPAILVEREGTRTAKSVAEVEAEATFWTVDSALVRAAEQLIKEVPRAASLSRVLDSLGAEGVGLPAGSVLSTMQPHRTLTKHIYDSHEVDAVVVNQKQRRLDLRWTRRSSPPRWFSLGEDSIPAEFGRATTTASRSLSRSLAKGILNLSVGVSPVEVEGVDGESVVRSRYQTFVLPGTALAKFLYPRMRNVMNGGETDVVRKAVADIYVALLLLRFQPETVDQSYLTRLTEAVDPALRAHVDTASIAAALGSEQIRVFDPAAWKRASPQPDGRSVDEQFLEYI